MASSSRLPSLRQVIDRHLAPAGPHVLTAHDRLEVPVSWVHSSEIFEIGPLLAGGELLLTTGLGLAGLDAGTRRHYVRDLAERGVAGIAFEVGRTFDAVPEEMLHEGSAAHLPIIELPRVVPFIEVCRVANSAIVADELTDLRLQSTLDAALHDDLTAPGGVAAMLGHLSDATGGPIVLVGTNGALIAAHGVDDDRAAWQVVDTALATATISVRGREIGRVVAGGAASGTSTSSTPSVSRARLADLLELATGPLGAVLTRTGPHRSTAGTRLVGELLDERAIRRADLFARLIESGIAITESMSLVPVAADAPDPRMAESALTQLTAALGGLITATIDATVYALVAVTASDTVDPVERVRTELISPGAHLARITVVIGESCAIRGATPGVELAARLGGSLQAAHERLALAISLRREKGSAGKVFTARELAADAALATLDTSTRAELARMIEPLRCYDEATSSELVITLETHLRNGCSATRSGQALHIGRQSLYQRLDRIRSLLGFDPTSPEMYASMVLATKVSRVK